MPLPQLARHDVNWQAYATNLETATLIAKRYGVAYGDGLSRAARITRYRCRGHGGRSDAASRHVDAALERGCRVHGKADRRRGRGCARDPGSGKKGAIDRRRRLHEEFPTANRIAHNVTRAANSAVAGIFGEYMTAPTYFTGNVDYGLLPAPLRPLRTSALLAGRVRDLAAFRNEIAGGSTAAVHVGFERSHGVDHGHDQSRGTPMERLQIMGDLKRIEVDGVIEVNYFPNPPFKADDLDATLADGSDTLSWKPNFTAAANETSRATTRCSRHFAALEGGHRICRPSICVEAMRV
jgi:myo-inositol 2-dehydrogenase/D-chiro-inositol 1-dehydrogenase